MNTQPRMVGVAGDHQIQFTRKDVTNYPGAPYGAMRAMTLTWVSADEITQRWIWNQEGKDIGPELFQFQRRK